MSAFEDYLTSIGYSRCSFNFKSLEWEEDKERYQAFSTYGPTIYTYKKEGYPTLQYGLDEMGYPPGLINPVPSYPEVERNLIEEGLPLMGGAHKSRILNNYTPQEIVTNVIEQYGTI